VLCAGRLLVANPLLPDSNFDRTVVLLLAYSEEGAFGLVLNRPSQMGVGEPLPQWKHLAAEPAVLFLGGPVAHQAVICLARGGPSPDQGDGPAGADEEAWSEEWTQVAPGVGAVDLEQDPDRIGGQVQQLRMFAGYAGWAPGQLEGEIGAGAWWVVDAEPGDPFTVEPADLWKQVLRRQPFPLKWVSWFPDDPAHQ
jgi:putative transcriptional regulator